MAVIKKQMQSRENDPVSKTSATVEHGLQHTCELAHF